ncbi:MAG: GxxExxY protein, partial [Pedobacter sp.]
VSTVAPIHIAQLLTYMKLLNQSIGLMINFNCPTFLKRAKKPM